MQRAEHAGADADRGGRADERAEDADLAADEPRARAPLADERLGTRRTGEEEDGSCVPLRCSEETSSYDLTRHTPS